MLPPVTMEPEPASAWVQPKPPRRDGSHKPGTRGSPCGSRVSPRRAPRLRERRRASGLPARRAGLPRRRTPPGAARRAPIFRRRRRGCVIGQWGQPSGLADRLADLHDPLAHCDELLVGGQFPAHFRQLRARQLTPCGLATGHRPGPQVPRPVARVIGLHADAVRFAAAAVVFGDRAAPKIAGVGELGIQPGSLVLQLG